MPDVRIEKLIKRFGNVEAIAGVDIHIPEGKIVTLLGPSMRQDHNPALSGRL